MLSMGASHCNGRPEELQKSGTGTKAEYIYYLAFDETSLLPAAIDPGDEHAGGEICQKMILSRMHSVFKTVLCGSDLSKVVE